MVSFTVRTPYGISELDKPHLIDFCRVDEKDGVALGGRLCVHFGAAGHSLASHSGFMKKDQQKPSCIPADLSRGPRKLKVCSESSKH